MWNGDELGGAIRGICRDIERRHDLGSGFFVALLKQNDWAFIIQSHALIEAAVSDALAARAGNVRLRAVFNHLPLSDVRSGKLAFAKAYGIMTDSQAKFVQFYSELRNQVVHNIGSVRFTFADHLASLDDNKRKKWCKRIAGATSESSDWTSESFAYKQPMSALWFAVVTLVYHVLPITDA